MLRLFPLSSSFHDAATVQATVDRLRGRLLAERVPHELALGAAQANALLVLTGGTEHLALEAWAGRPEPALILAHPDQNSLPAALEILARIRQEGRRGRILMLHDAPGAFEELRRAAALLDLHERLQKCRLGRIGAPSDWLVASVPEASALRETWGPEPVELELQGLREAMAGADPVEVEAIARDFREGAEAILEPDAEALRAAARVAAALRRTCREHRLDAFTLRCFDLVTGCSTTGCLGLSLLDDEGVVAGCEGDLPAVLTLLWTRLATGHPAFMANPQDLDPAANTLWLAHCTLPRRLCGAYRLRSHFESGLGVGLQGRLEPGPVTLVRVGGPDLRGLFLSDGELLANGDSERRCRTQVQLRLQRPVTELLDHPLGNHHVLVPGHWADLLRAYHALFIEKA